MVPHVNRYVDSLLSGNLLNIHFPLPEKGGCDEAGERWAAMNQGRGRRKEEKGLRNGEGGRGGVSPFADEEKAAASTISRQRRGGIGDKTALSLIKAFTSLVLSLSTLLVLSCESSLRGTYSEGLKDALEEILKLHNTLLIFEFCKWVAVIYATMAQCLAAVTSPISN
ncbi:hypothetical protein B296_00016283 [Ensete ventricosum]|uniref:Uncharacterized protein n=1 Tax=Ensete ventricosum TaxID=4639 RepID=A0A426ZFK0_ENSVE|nr:hypothetical protein B296_00016283 [Ensete ventricosum]